MPFRCPHRIRQLLMRGVELSRTLQVAQGVRGAVLVLLVEGVGGRGRDDGLRVLGLRRRGCGLRLNGRRWRGVLFLEVGADESMVAGTGMPIGEAAPCVQGLLIRDVVRGGRGGRYWSGRLRGRQTTLGRAVEPREGVGVGRMRHAFDMAGYRHAWPIAGIVAPDVGNSMSKGMTKLFDAWRKKAEKGPIILFVDEIDTIGRRNGNGHNESWFTSVINAWLAFLDGAVPRDGIVVVAATNHPDRVDPALRRPGRLDRHVELPMPDVAALTSIVRAHLGADAVLTDDELAEAARACRGRSPAEIGLLAREARRIARWCGRRVCASDLTDVVAMGRADEVPETMRRIAVHEAGHAVAGVLLDADTLTCVDLDAGRTSYTRLSIDTPTALDKRVVMMLSARAAEQVLLGEVSTGCARDLEDATLLVSDMRATWGMGDAGLVSIATAATIHDPRHQAYVRRTLDAAYARAVELMTGGRNAVERVADALLRQRYLDADEVRALVAGPMAGPPRVRRTAPMMGGAIKRVVGGRATGPDV
ncbi:AAA family ATPase [Lichenibacterium minor]|uniref:AAA family ATPase n=2 Tax=Lichenibacterium minor TaxID=2316528 RepID=A0A4Q2U2B8_9HYPH|nr:AAA family ATPase [Lichenibacterium minor]